MLLDEKRLKSVEYAVQNYGFHTLSFLVVYRVASSLVLETVKLDGVVLERIETGNIPFEGDAGMKLSFKQMIQIGTLSKIMMLIESLAALCLSLAEEPTRLASRMVGYPTRSTREFIQRLAKGKVGDSEIKMILALPETSSLNLEPEEGELAETLLRSSVGHTRVLLSRLASFYLTHEVIYVKYKHGLAIVPGLRPTEGMPPISMALDRQPREDVPVVSVRPEDLPPFEPWYRVMSLVPYDQRAFDQYAELANLLKVLLRNIVEGHLTKIANCGVGYVPPYLIVDPDFPDAQWTRFDSVVTIRIAPNQNKIDPRINYVLNLGPESRDAVLAAFRAGNAINFAFSDTINDLTRGVELSATRSLKIERVPLR